MSFEPMKWSPSRIVAEIPAVLLIISILVTAWFVLGSFVTYAPSIDATTMQNIYLTRILRYGSAIAILNALAVLSLGLGRRSRRGD
jgi:hypothetical protein